MFILYKIYYGDELVYIGRTHQELRNRLRHHFFNNPIVKKIDIFQTTKIEYTVLNTESDMFLYEIYEICRHKPRLNVDDKAKDEFSPFIRLPELVYHEYYHPLLDKWKDKSIEYLIDTSPLDFDLDEGFYF